MSLSSLKAGIFRLSRHHYSNHRWYGYYKERELKRILDQPFTPSLPPGYGRWLDERVVEYPWMLSRLPEHALNLLDAGSTLNHRLILDRPQISGRNLTIMTLAPEQNCFWRDRVSYVFGDLRQTYFRDHSFDAVICLSVLEHIGLDNQKYAPATRAGEDVHAHLDAVTEFRRVLKPNGICLLSVPFGRREVRDWLQVFDSTMLQSILNVFAPEEHRIHYFVYSDADGWQSSTEARASDAPYFDLNSDKPWPGCPAGAGAIACLELKR